MRRVRSEPDRQFSRRAVRATKSRDEKNNFGREQQAPLMRGGVVFRPAADEFVMAGDMFHEPGWSIRDGGGLKREGNER